MKLRLLIFSALLLSFSLITYGMTTGCSSGGVTDKQIEDSADVDRSPTADNGDVDGDGTVNLEDEDDDNDGSPDSEDCEPFNAEVYPGAEDRPDENFTDSNCDGLDGDLSNAVWVSDAEGDDTNPGTIESPLKTISEGIEMAASFTPVMDVYIVKGEYTEDVELTDGISLFGGYGDYSDGIRPRDITANVTEVTGTGNLFLDIKIDGNNSNYIGYTLLIENSDSIVGGLTITGGENDFGQGMSGFNIVILNSSATIEDSIINESVPAVTRDISLNIAALIDQNAGEDVSVKIHDNKINLEGNGANQGMELGLIAIPTVNATRELKFSVEGNNIISRGETNRRLVIYGVDNDDNPNDDTSTDGKPGVYLSARNNDIDISGLFDTALAIVGGRGLLGSIIPNEPYSFTEGFIAEKNRINIQVDDGTDNSAGGIIVTLARSKSLLANNIISITGDMAEFYGVLTLNTRTDIYYNDIYFNGRDILGIGIASMLQEDAEIINYLDTPMGDVINNIVSANIEKTSKCGAMGFYEMTSSSNDPALKQNVSPRRFLNNDLYFNTNCDPQEVILYRDTQVGSNLDTTDIDDLNNKSGFDPDDPTESADNISTDPQFQDPANNNFIPLNTSPCIDRGFNFEDGWMDFSGTLRPQGSEVDIGAYEQ